MAGLVLCLIVAAGCSSAPPRAPARPAASFVDGLSLGMSFGSALAAGDKSVTAKFALTNNRPTTFEGCFGPAWGVSVIVLDGHDAGHYVRADHPKCDERFKLVPGQRITWSKTVPLTNLRPGPAKVTGWVRIVDPSACDQARGCRDASVASPLMTVAIGGR